MRILVIEDEPRILGFLKVGLEAEGFAVDPAEDGVTGLALALCEPYELVVLDLQLPRLDGLRVLDELHRGRPELPVLILSARSDLPTKLRSFQLGANDYLSKPFSFDELVARVRVQLRHGGGDDASTVRVGALVLDLTRRQARVEDHVTDLSDREFRLLYHLVAHAGEVVSRERLLSEVWGYSFDPGSNVVDVCVRRLRKRLGPGSPIETVRHAGYRLAVA
ncbi:MAG: two component transcriptional regulator, winged helix family [Actinomycetia bacterium]|jgi:DNA-binding response OmpR family regulator|nr:two component transcriptional regulator, winged helix family [Actinomycetes bacterium]